MGDKSLMAGWPPTPSRHRCFINSFAVVTNPPKPPNTNVNTGLSLSTMRQLQLHQPGKELNMVHPLGGALLGHLVVFSQDGRQLQRLEVMRQKKFGGVGHAASLDTRHM